MKSFWGTLIVFLLLLCAVAGNFFYINQTADALAAGIDAIEQGDVAENAEALYAFWRTNRSWVSLTVSYQAINEMDRSLAELRATACGQDAAELRLACLGGQDAAEHIRRLERFSIENIF